MNSYNFAEIIRTSAARAPLSPAIIAQGRTISYGELRSRTNQAGNLFAGLGVEPGDRVAVLFINDFRFLEICFGLMTIGAVPVPMNSKLGADTLAYIYRDSGSRLLVYHSSMGDKAKIIHQEADVAASVICTTESHPDDLGLNSLVYDEILSSQDTQLDLYPTRGGDLCLLPYTSGSTGNPKGCRLTHSGQLWNVTAIAEIRDLQQEDRIVISLPLYHKNAMLSMKAVFYSGSSAVILPAPEPAAIFHAIGTHRATYISGVPALYRMLVTHLKESPASYDLSSLKYAICGSSDTPVELLEDIKQWMGIEVYEGYGLTEGGPVVLESRKGLHKPGSAGFPLPGCSIRIVNATEADVPEGTIGELWVSNPGVADGYWNLPDVTRKRITSDGWLKTGDMAWQDDEGYVYIVGRKDDMINVGGENVYPKEVENILLQHPHVEDACVLPIPHELKGEVPVAFVVLNHPTDREEIKRFFIERGPAYAHPREIYELDAFPLTGPGKVDRTRLKQMLAEQLQKGVGKSI
ncbi:class I adenylate-forming enzyme family protein [Paenibacillus favisporus]|uniref:class I adenylate-forming enzyme family protein n=1 Tax=Paenibacillus TaxID=44249 RepID=UPI0011AB778C|nr:MULTISPECIES: class I adenylate-forming enzyme family protein [Paenibacillus]MEC0174135.1 class I adenylate-forming enzyme family protein [Paenibacillus favisporus]